MSINETPFQYFQEHMRSHSALSGADFDRLRSTSQVRRMRKHQYLLQAGDTSNSVAFVCRGCLRMYGVNESGEEHILRFSSETWWVGDRESYTTGLPSTYHIDALEDCTLLVWSKTDFDTLIADLPELRTYVDALMQRNANAISQRIYRSISSTAEEKYQHFVEQHPDLMQRVPLHMVASYLGLSRETLSRVRRKLLDT